MADLTDHDAPMALNGRGAGETRFVGRVVYDKPAATGLERLRTGGPVLHELIAREHRRQAETLTR